MRDTLRLEDVRLFLDLAKERNFSVVAERYGITQSALSKRIDKLEDHFGKRLINRGSYGVGKLTEYGGELKPYFETIVETEKRIASLSVGWKYVFSIKAGTGFNPDVIFDVLEGMNNGQAREFSFSIASSDEVLGEVKNGLIDIGIVGQEIRHPDLYSRRVYSEQIVLVAKDEYPSFDIRRIYELPLVFHQEGSGLRAFVMKSLEEFGIDVSRLNIRMSCGFNDFALKAVARGLGCAFLAEDLVPPEFKIIWGADEPRLRRSFWALCKKKEILEEFLDTVKQQRNP